MTEVYCTLSVQYVRGMNAGKEKLQKYKSPTLELSYPRLGAS